jgi:hypothetical protein
LQSNVNEVATDKISKENYFRRDTIEAELEDVIEKENSRSPKDEF